MTQVHKYFSIRDGTIPRLLFRFTILKPWVSADSPYFYSLKATKLYISTINRHFYANIIIIYCKYNKYAVNIILTTQVSLYVNIYNNNKTLPPPIPTFSICYRIGTNFFFFSFFFSPPFFLVSAWYWYWVLDQCHL